MKDAAHAATHAPGRRSLARRLTVQALYQWLLNKTPAEAMERQFREQPEGLGRADRGYFDSLLQGTVAEVGRLDTLLVPHLDRPLEQLDPVEHAVLLLGAYELSAEPGVPWRVIVNEAVELTKLFGAEDGYKYVNGVLDRLAHDLRPVEIGA
ncbi:MAG TPA: transcription antitermination factor NusB [Nevskiaceae bacterium]|nr:transcription antitermination factor NusB [Nevskiaceae bacterium]